MAGKGAVGLMAMIFMSFGFMGGCGQSHASNGGQGNGRPNGGSGGIVAGSIQTWIDVKQEGNTARFTFHLKNQTEHVKTFHFNTGKRFDCIVKDANGNKVYQCSDGMMYNQMAGKETLKQGEEMSFQGKVTGLDKGKYTVTFWLTARDEQPKATKSFEIH